MTEIEKFCQKRLVKKSKLLPEEKPNRAQIFRYFRYESWNNDVDAKKHEFSINYQKRN